MVNFQCPSHAFSQMPLLLLPDSHHAIFAGLLIVLWCFSVVSMWPTVCDSYSKVNVRVVVCHAISVAMDGGQTQRKWRKVSAAKLPCLKQNTEQ